MYCGTRLVPPGRRRGVTLAILGVLGLGVAFAVVPTASAQAAACARTRSDFPYVMSCVEAVGTGDGADYSGWVSLPADSGGVVDVGIYDESFRRVDNIRYSFAPGGERTERISGHSFQPARYIGVNVCDTIPPPRCGSSRLEDVG